MAAIVEQANLAFRDYETDGVPSTLPHEPSKPDIRAIFPLIEAALADIGLMGAVDVAFATVAEMEADSSQADGALALVYADNASPPTNGVYIWWDESPAHWEATDFVSASAIYEAVLAAQAATEQAALDAAGSAESSEASADTAALSEAAAAVSASAAAGGSRIFSSKAKLLTDLGDGERAGLAPAINAWAGRTYEDVGGVATPVWGVFQSLGTTTMRALLQQVRQDEIEAASPFPRMDVAMFHVRAIDAGLYQGQVAPNRWRTKDLPTRWNWLNWNTGEIRFTSTSNHTITRNAVGTAARIQYAASGTTIFRTIGQSLPDAYTLWALASRWTGAASDQSVRGLQTDEYSTEVLGAASAVVDWPVATQSADLTIQLAGTGVAADILIDHLFMDDGLAAPTWTNDNDWHLKANFACPGALPLRTAHGGYEIDDTPAQSFLTGVVDPTADTITIPAHGLATGDGPFVMELGDPRTWTVAATAASDTLATTTVHAINTGFGPFQIATTGTLPAGLAVNTDYWAIRIDALTIKVASSYANAIAKTAVDITDAGTGTHTINCNMPGGVGTLTSYWVIRVDADTISLATTRANAMAATKLNLTDKGNGHNRLKTRPMSGMVMMNPAFPSKATLSAEGCTIQWVGSFHQIANDGLAWCLNYDNSGVPSVLSSTFGFGTETDGQAMLYPNQGSNRVRAWINLIAQGRQVWTAQVKNGQQVLWKGHIPALHSTAPTWAGVDIWALLFNRYVGTQLSIPTGGQCDKRMVAACGWNTFLTPDEVHQAVDTQLALCAAEGNPVDVSRVEHVVYGTSIDSTIPGIPGVRWWQLGMDLSWDFSWFCCASGGKSLGGSDGTTPSDAGHFRDFANYDYGTKAVVRGALRNGSKVFLYGAGNATNDAQAIVHHYSPAEYPTATPLGPQDFYDFMTEIIEDAGGTEGVDVFGFMGDTPARDGLSAQGSFMTQLPIFNAEREALAAAGGRYWLSLPDGTRTRTQGTGTEVDITTGAGIIANSPDGLHPGFVAHGDWAERSRLEIEAALADVFP